MRGIRRTSHQGGGDTAGTPAFRFLTDQDVYESTVRLLADAGYDVKRARDIGLSAAADTVLLAQAEQERRILVTRDKGFGQLVFSRRQPHAGIILLRVTPDSVEEVHYQLLQFLSRHTPEQLSSVFVTIEPGRYRVRKSPTMDE